MQRLVLTIISAGLITLPSAAVHAGPYADELSKCLVESTSQRDRTELVRWFFASASLHPDVRPMTSVTEEDLDVANKTIAALMVSLLTERCRAETEQALKYEGQSTIEVAFSVLGQVAGKELFSSPEVAEALSGLEGHIDKDALGTLEGLQ